MTAPASDNVTTRATQVLRLLRIRLIQRKDTARLTGRLNHRIQLFFDLVDRRVVRVGEHGIVLEGAGNDRLRLLRLVIRTRVLRDLLRRVEPEWPPVRLVPPEADRHQYDRGGGGDG